MSDTLRVPAVGYDDPSLADRDGFAVHAAGDAGDATAVLETSPIDCVVAAADSRQGVSTTVQNRFPDLPVLVYADIGSVAVARVTDDADAFVPREGVRNCSPSACRR